MSYSFKLRGHVFIASTLAEVSTMYSRERDASGEGMSTFPTANVIREGKVIGYVSYNGRIWGGKPQARTFKLLYDNR